MGPCPSVDLFYKHIYHLSNILAGKGFVYSVACDILTPNFSETAETLSYCSGSPFKKELKGWLCLGGDRIKVHLCWIHSV